MPSHLVSWWPRPPDPTTNSRPLSTVLIYPSVLNHLGGEVRQGWGNQRRVAIRIPAAWRRKPALWSTWGGMLTRCHKTLGSSACQTAGIRNSQWDGNVPPGGRRQEGCSYSGVQAVAVPSPQPCPLVPQSLTDVGSETRVFWAKWSGQREAAFAEKSREDHE